METKAMIDKRQKRFEAICDEIIKSANEYGNITTEKTVDALRLYSSIFSSYFIQRYLSKYWRFIRFQILPGEGYNLCMKIYLPE